jgi:hypothetical protein
MKIVPIIVLGLSTVVVSASVLPQPVQASLTVVPKEDASGAVGMFSVRNPTGATIRYSVRWGSDGDWERHTLAPGQASRHWYKLDRNDRAPAPYVRFDNTGGDGRVTFTTYHMKFRKVVSRDGRAVPKQYVFEYAADGRHLNLREL